MKFIYLLFFLSFTAQSQENCTFNYYNKKGGHYLFSTYYQSDMQTKMEGTCASSFNGQLYEKRIFSNGRIIEETLNYIDFKQRIRYTLDHNPKDSIISTLKEYQENGKLKLEWIFYYNKQNRRCQKTIEYFPNGKVRFINHRAWVKETELDHYLKPHYPPHTIDEDGYTYLSVPIGLEESYHENGKLATRNFNTFVVSEYAYQMSKDGPFVQYFDNGQLQITGQYKNGKVNGKIQTFHYSGELCEEKYYQNDVSIGTWKAWHSSGKQWYILNYDSLAQNPFQATLEKYWNEKGILVKEFVLDRNGTGKEKMWYENGKPMLEEDIFHYQRYDGIKREWYATGILKRYHNKSAKADTTVIENYEDGRRKFLSTNAFNGNAQQHTQKEWYPTGILKSELAQKTGGSLQVTETNNYYPNGVLAEYKQFKGDQRIEESYYPNERKIRSAFYNHGNLEGNYQTFDSLGNVLEHFHYKNGLRHGICRIYNPKGTLLFANNYVDGCMEKTTKEAIILNRRSIKDLSPGLRMPLPPSVCRPSRPSTEFAASGWPSICRCHFRRAPSRRTGVNGDMTPGRALLLGLLVAAAPVRAAEPGIQFTGVLTADGKTRLALTDKATDTTQWVEPGAEFKGYAITRYDATEEAVFVKRAGTEYRLPLASPQHRPALASATPAPAAASEPTQRAIRTNLRALAAAARQYQLERGVTSVAFTDLVGPGKFIGELKSVAGENYSTLNFSPEVTAISVTTTDGATVAIDLSTGLAQAPTPPAAPSPVAATPPPAPPPATSAPLTVPAAAPAVASAPPPTPEALPPTGREPVSPTYQIQGGDTWQKIAEATGVSVPELKRLNPTVNGGSPPAGETIRIK